MPGPDEILVETFPRGQRHYLVCYPFEGRLAHQSLGMLLTRRLERARAKPLGFVANEYALGVWGLARHGRDDQERAARPRAAVRRGHARRRSRRLAGRVEPDEALLPRLRHHLRADRAPPSRAGEDRPADDGLLRPHLRRAAPARARPYSAASCLRRCRNRPDRRRAAGRLFAADPRQNQAYSACRAFRRSPCRSCSRSAARAFPAMRAKPCCARRSRS